MTPKEAYWKCYEQGSRNPELEPIILQDPERSYWYARNIIEGRWTEGEQIILGSKYESAYCDYFRIEPCDLDLKPDYIL